MDARRRAEKVLAEFLESDYTPKECMNLRSAHGLMTSVVIGPKLILPSRWMPVMFRTSEQEQVNYINSRHASKIHELIMDMYDDIAWEFSEYDGAYFQPLLALEGTDMREALFRSLVDWCSGFIEGVIMEIEAWSRLTEDDDNSWLMETLLMFGTKEGRKEASRLSERHLLGRAVELPEILREIYLYWLERRQMFDAELESVFPADKLPI